MWDDHERPLIGGSDGARIRRRAGLAQATIGVIVGLAISLVFLSPNLTSSGNDEGSLPSRVTTTAAAADLEQLHDRIGALEAELQASQDNLLDLGLTIDPVAFSTVLGCEDAVSGGLTWPDLFAGPIGFSNLDQALAAVDGGNEVLAILGAGRTVTMVVPDDAEDGYQLLWGGAGDGPQRAITLEACEDRTTGFTGGFAVAAEQCAPLDIYDSGSTVAQRLVLPFGGIACEPGSLALRPLDPGAPIPDVVGLTVSEAQLEIRITARTALVFTGDPAEPEAMVWSMESAPGVELDASPSVVLRTCLPATRVVDAYNSVLDDDRLMLSDAWLAPSHDPDRSGWWFVSAHVSREGADPEIATWVLPAYNPRTGSIVSPSLSIPANEVADRLGFGDRRFTREDFDIEAWLDFDGARASQSCVELATG